MSKIDKNGNVEITTSSNLKEGAKNGTFKDSSKKINNVSRIGLFKIIILLIFVVSFVGYLRTGTATTITFKGILEFLADAPSFDISWSMIDLTIYADWGIFNFLRSFFNWFTDMFEVLLSIFGMSVETIEFLFYFVKGLFFK